MSSNTKKRAVRVKVVFDILGQAIRSILPKKQSV